MNARCPRISKYWNKTVGDWNVVYVKKLKWSKSFAGFVVMLSFFRGFFFNIIISLSFLARFFPWFFLSFVRVLLIFFLVFILVKRFVAPNGYGQLYYYKYFWSKRMDVWCSMFNVVMVFTVNYVIVIYHPDLVICHRTNHKIVSN